MILAEIDSRNLLFDEAAQAVYELDDFSTYVWRSLKAGLDQKAMVREIIDAGADADEASELVAAAVQKIRDLETSTPADATAPASLPEQPLGGVTLCLAGVAVQLNASDLLLDDVRRAFGRLICDTPKSHVQLSARLDDETVEILLPGSSESLCERSEFAPLIKALLIDSVLRFARYEVALHAAALVRDEKALLLLGSPGSGKTTLATALVKSGFEIAADDVVLLDDSGRVSGLPLPFTIKESAWPLLSREWPDLENQQAHIRPDGIKVRYLAHEAFADAADRQVQFVVLLRRDANARVCLEPVGTLRALEALIAEGDARDDRLTETGFTSLVTALRDTRCFVLTYSDLREATDLVSTLYS